MHRALWEFRIRGVATNLRFLDQVITHPKFAHGDYTTKFIDETPELFKWEKKKDRATRILSFIGDTIVNGGMSRLLMAPCFKVIFLFSLSILRTSASAISPAAALDERALSDLIATGQ